MNDPHYHQDPKTGFLTKCYKHCSNLLGDYRFWIGVTISYPIEHFIWENIWPFNVVMQTITM